MHLAYFATFKSPETNEVGSIAFTNRDEAIAYIVEKTDDSEPQLAFVQEVYIFTSAKEALDAERAYLGNIAKVATEEALAKAMAGQKKG